MMALQSFETSGTTYRTIERHIPEERSLEQHLYENLGACTSCDLFRKFIFVLLKIKNTPTCIHIFVPLLRGDPTLIKEASPQPLALHPLNVLRLTKEHCS